MDIIPAVLDIGKLLWSPIGRRIGYIKNHKRNMDDLEKNATPLFAQLLDVQEMIKTEQLKVATEVCRCWIDDVEKAKGEVDSIKAKCEEDDKCLAGWCPNVKSRMELGKHIVDMIQEMKNLNSRQLAFVGREFRDAPLHDIENLRRNMDDLEKNATPLFAQLLDVQEMIKTEQLKVATEECGRWIDDVEKAKGEVDSIKAKRGEDISVWCPNVESRMELGKHIKDMIQEIKNLNDRRLAFAGREFRDAPLHDIENLRRNMDDLEKNATPLFAQLLDVQEMIKTEQLKVATEECRRWIDDVEKAKGEVDSIKAKREEDISGWCPNVKSRMELGKHIVDMIQEMKNLNDRRLAFAGREFRDAPLQSVEPQIVETNSSTDFEPRLQRILGLIKDVGFCKIGIWGMGGIGKTRTLKLLNNLLEESHLFDVIIWVTVSGEGSRSKVQNDIAERLKCTATADDRLRANICNHLSGKKFLLILDDIWERIDLSDVGIPILNQDNGCKVLLTTRDLDVCRQMQTDKEIQMEKLSDEEAWSLFNEKAGDVAMSPRIEPIARDIVKKCGGLPLAILVIGSSLRKNSDVCRWRNTLRKLKLPSTSSIKGMEKEVFSCLRISYDRLSEDSERNFFLYCSLYPEDYKILIAELAEYCYLEGYIQGVDSIEEARDEGRDMVMNLVDASLLERVDHSEEYVKMHDIIRDFALKEASSRFFVKTGRHVKHPPEEKEWLQSQKISLMRCSLDCLSERPNSASLSTLLLQSNGQLTMIPDSFFECMHSLCILDLSWTQIKSLPSSLWDLVNLRGLYLKNCRELEELPSQVGTLKKLEVLDLGGRTGIKYLPREVGELTRLKRLIVAFRYRRKCSQNDGEDTKECNMKLRVPTGIIPELPYLEELSLYVANSLLDCGYFEKEQWDDESMEVVVEELCMLEHLTSLDVYFPKVECLEHFLRHSKSVKATSSWFRRSRFRVGAEIRDRSRGYRPEWVQFLELQKWWLVYKGGFGMSHVAAITETLAHSSFFHLQNHRTARKLSELGQANMKELKGCYVRDCEKMESLFDGDELQEACALLPNLEILDIQHLPKLRSLCDGPLLPGSLSKLRYLKIKGCKNLKKVFQLGIIRQLCSLEILFVSECSKMEEIIEIEEASHTHNVISYNNDILILPNIKTIYLWNLPELVSICRGFSNFEWPSLQTIYIVDCPKLKSLSFLSNGTNIVAPALKEIYGSSSWWEALEWEDNDIKQRLQPFFSKRR